MELMDVDNFSQRIEKLEDDELELKLSKGLYVELLAFYLLQERLVEAKCLVQRIPADLRTDKELAQLDLLLHALSKNNTAEFFKHLNFHWSDLTKDIIKNLKEKTLDDIFTLVSNAYTSISEKNLMHMTQMSRENLRSVCEKLGWSYEMYNHQVVILPTPRIIASSNVEDSKEQLFKLTEFVTFLEA